MRKNGCFAAGLVLIGAGFSFGAQASRVASGEQGPCSEYVMHCKAVDMTSEIGLINCVTEEAKKANNKECLAKMKKAAQRHKAHRTKNAE